jgi:F0F1-type ATP synthase assembly protein I
MAAGFFVGRWGDGRLGTAPWLSLLGFVVGVYAGFRQLFRTAAKMTAEAEREDAAASGPEPTETWREPAPPEDRRDGR